MSNKWNGQRYDACLRCFQIPAAIPRCPVIILAIILVIITGGIPLLHAQEVLSSADKIAPFKFTRFEQSIELRFRDDEQISGLGLMQQRSIFEQELSLRGQAYVYHPHFLKLDLGFAPIFRQTDLTTTVGENSGDSTDYNFFARFKFLEKKLFPITLFYEKQHPFVQLSLTDRFEQESEKKGFELNLRAPLLPFSVAVGSMQIKNKGEGFDLRIDNEINQKYIRANIPMGVNGTGNLNYTTTDKVSRSGLLSQPITTTEIKTDSLNFDSRNLFGKDNKLQFNNQLSYTERVDVRPLKEMRYAPRLRWIHSDKLETFYQLDYVDTDQETVATKQTGFQTGLYYKINKATQFDVGINTNDHQTTGLVQNGYGLTSRISHVVDTPIGKLSFNGNLNFEFLERKVTSTVPVVDQVLTLNDTVPQFLVNDNIISSTIQVFRLVSGSETPLIVGIDTNCGAAIDILITTIDAQTQIENCNGATDGVITVNIDYTHNPGGSVSYHNFDQFFSANLEINQYSNIYLRLRDSNVSVKEGDPALSLDESTSFELGGRFNYPVSKLFNVGGEYTYEQEKGTLLTLNRELIELYTRFKLKSTNIQFNVRNTVIDYRNSVQGVDATRYAISFRMKPWRRFLLFFDYSSQQDDGGSVNQKNNALSLKLRWRKGKLNFQGEVNLVKDKFDSVTRERSNLQFSLRRDF